MAKLPSEAELGGISNPASGRPIATYDVTGYARGAAAIAGGVSDLGKGVSSASKDITAALVHERATDDKLEVARARADFLTKKIELDTSFKDDQDYETLQERYNTKLGEIKSGSSGLISNPKTRELFDLSITDDVAKAAQGANLQANKIWKDKTLADSSTQLEAIRQAALKTQDPEERVKLIDSGNQIISSLADKNITSHAAAADTKKKWTSDYAYGAISLLPAAERVAVLDGFQGALKKQESGGNPAKVNQLGYAGLYQFGAPRLAAMGVYSPGAGESMDGWSKTSSTAPGKWTGTFNIPGRPDIKTIKDFLANPSAQEEAFQIHTQKMDQEIKSNGLEKYIGQTVGGQMITREGLHAMMHLGGAGGAKRTLESDGKDSPKDANGTSVLSYARFGNQSGLSRIASLIPEDERNKLRMNAQNEVDRTTVKDAMVRSEVHDRAITDAAAGVSPLPSRSSITDDPALDEPRRNALLKQYDSAAGDVAKLERAVIKFRDPNAGSFNPYDKDDRDNTDKIYKALGGDVPAMQAVVQRTGIVPKAAVIEMRGGLASADPQRVGASLQLAANLVGGDKPDMFAGIDGGKELSEAGLSFRHYVYDRGMTAQEATAKIMEERTPEYQQKTKARIKSEDVNAIVKKQLNDGDIRSAFDPSFLGLAPNPQLAFNPETRQRAMGDYEEVFREKFAANGDVALSKKLALEDMKKTWGVSSVSGSKTVMKYPPERSPVYAGIENASEHIAAQAVSAIKDLNGADVDRSKIRLDEVKSTGQRYMTGQPPTYVLSYVDKNGHVQTIPKQFYADPVPMKDTQTSKRAAESARIQERVNIDADMADLSRANFGVGP
jgi:hypothetical protein